MHSAVKSLTVSYDPINELNTFTSGDCVSGQIALQLTKKCKIDTLSITLKGKAEVKWSEGGPRYGRIYHANDNYFTVNKDIIQPNDRDRGNIIAPGHHTYPFTFQIPDQDLPASFAFGCFVPGQILYTLEARLSRSMRRDSKATATLNFVSKTDLDREPWLKNAQHGTKNKKMKLFSSGTVSMDVNIERMGYYQGEAIKIISYIQNSSSHEIKPKYHLYKKNSFFANGKRRLHTYRLVKEVGEPIPPSASQTATKIINIPPDSPTSILNCNILKSEYRLQVYLDVKLHKDPGIKFPIVILPASQSPAVQQPPPYSGFGFEISGTPESDVSFWSSPSQFPTEPTGPPPPYETYGMYPPLAPLSGFDSSEPWQNALGPQWVQSADVCLPLLTYSNLSLKDSL